MRVPTGGIPERDFPRGHYTILQPGQNLHSLRSGVVAKVMIHRVPEMASPLRLVTETTHGQDALMKKCRQASQLIVVLMAAAVNLAWETGCSRQLAVPASAGNAGSAPLPFDRVSDNSGISPTAGFSFDGIPAGTEVTVRLQSALSSANSRAGDSFQAVLVEPMVVGDKMVVPPGAVVTGSVVGGKTSGGSNDPGYLRVTLASIAMNGKPVPLETSSIFAKGGSRERHGASTEPSINHGQGDVRFSTGRRLTFRLVQPLHL
jgi:hypothetical protein